MVKRSCAKNVVLILYQLKILFLAEKKLYPVPRDKLYVEEN